MVFGADAEPDQLLGAIFSGSPDAIVVIDEQANIVLSSPAVSALFGYYPEELVGLQLDLLLPEDRHLVHGEHVKSYFADPRPRAMGAGLELAGRHRDGSTFPIDVSLAPVSLHGQQFVAAFVRDASQRERDIARLRAVNMITQQLLGGAPTQVIYPMVAATARRLLHADAAWVVRPSQTGGLEVVSVDGEGSELLLGSMLSEETSHSAQVMRTGKSKVIADLSADFNVPPKVPVLDLGPGVYVPLSASERRLGTLVFARVHGSPTFDAIEVAFAELFSNAISAAIELGETRGEIERLGLIAEDERIARDLHDTVIQQLFALGMSLQATRRDVDERIAARLDDVVDSLDDVIKQIRNTIFRLPVRHQGDTGVRNQLLQIGDRYHKELGFQPRIVFDGPVEAALPDPVVEQLVIVVGELMSNIARHARASSAEIVVAVGKGTLSLSVADDGKGWSPSPTAGNGLRNVVQRAVDLGGESRVRQRMPSGTIVEWIVPLVSE